MIAIKEIPSVNPTTDFSVNRIVPETTDATLTDTFVPFVAPVDSFSSFHKIDETSASNEAVENLFPANEIANEETVTIDPVANPIGGCDVICSGTKGESSKAPPSVETQTPPKEISSPVKETSTPTPAISTPSHTVTQTPTRLNVSKSHGFFPLFREICLRIYPAEPHKINSDTTNRISQLVLFINNLSFLRFRAAMMS